ncbi:hypothetical protein [Streptomyces sp. CdTB01]|uniref:YxiG-like protein n=1 Tax=Streptomyces sp. CdTB01 TaxID=1725411 RepID=UPI00073ACA06|nr:hypothetical protein [Streptomyces sp. CdTB01]ALV35988.1 hypothetical protein AS200_31020 [Streptomyces sp. CdTB01]
MDVPDLQRVLDEMFDHALIYHGYADYMRDYEVIVYMAADPSADIPPAHYRYLFRHCVEARCKSSLAPATWQASLDDRLTAHETGKDLDGFVWGVKWQPLCPGATVVPGSEAAARWARAIGIDFHEVRIETNAHDLTLVFSDLQVSEVPLGYAPFTAVDEWSPTGTRGVDQG